MPVATRQPAHIHKGSCEELDPTPAYGLNDVKAGKSTSTVDVRLDDLIDDTVVINVHESAENVERYVACGVISAGDGKGDDPLGHERSPTTKSGPALLAKVQVCGPEPSSSRSATRAAEIPTHAVHAPARRRRGRTQVKPLSGVR